jgi:hypothetical protein
VAGVTIMQGHKFKGRHTKPLDVSQKKAAITPNRSPQQKAKDRARAKRARTARAKQKGRR